MWLSTPGGKDYLKCHFCAHTESGECSWLPGNQALFPLPLKVSRQNKPVVAMERHSVTAPNIVMAVPKEIRTRNFGLHPTIVGESACSANRLGLISVKENFRTSYFLID